jgi:hypothetical protein
MAQVYDIDYAAVGRYMLDEPGALEAHLAEAPEVQRPAVERERADERELETQ